MELLFDIDNYEEKMSSDELTLKESDKKKIIEDVAISNVERVEYANIGCGADWIVILIGIVIIGYNVLKSGKSVDDGIDGWIEIGKKLKILVKRNKVISVDSEGATLLAIEAIAQLETINVIEVFQENTINLVTTL